MCTHLHLDHVGWNTRLLDGRWVPTFPQAKYILSRRECEFWDTRSGEGGKLPINDNVFEDSVRPILDAGLAELIDPPFQLTDELTIEAAPGHRSEEHTSELQSLMRSSYAVFCLKKKK